MLRIRHSSFFLFFLFMLSCTQKVKTHSNINKTMNSHNNIVSVILTGQGGKQVVVSAELALTPAEREKGLMFRKFLSPNHGMLFVFPVPEKTQFWMKNTYIPLDMLFIDKDNKIVYIVKNAKPLNESLLGPENKPVKYVLEVPGNFADKYGIRVGSKVKIQGNIPSAY